MRWSVAALAVLLLLPVAQAGEKKAIKSGFRDLKWGEAPTADMSLLGEEGNVSTYRRATDELSIGGIQLKEIAYRFYKGKLMSVYLSSPPGTGPDLLLVLQAQWGKGLQSNRYMRDTIWFSGDRDFGTTTASFDENTADHSSKMLIWSERIHNEKTADTKAAGAKAKDDL